MAAKYQLMTELYRRTSIAVTKNPKAWQSFLDSACHNYKCRFDEQLLIYAQRPDATAVAEIGTWNRLFKRWVNKDSKGIAVFHPKGLRNTLRYYFDISDTHEGYYGSLPVPIWQMDVRYEQPVIECLADRFGDINRRDLVSALMETAENVVEDNLPDYLAQLTDCTKDSYLEELDGFNIGVIYRKLTTRSVAFMLLCRCGLDTELYFDREDFADIVNFNTPSTLNAIGIAVSDISEMTLREISQAIRNVQIEAKRRNRIFARNITSQYDKGRTRTERSEDNERYHLQQTGGLSYSRPHISDRARTSPWQIRFDAQGLSGESPTGGLSQSTDIGQAERTSSQRGTDGTRPTGEDDKEIRGRTGSDGGIERKSSDAVDTDDERNTQSGRGSDTERVDLLLETAEPEPAEDEQLGIATEEEVKANLPTIDEQIEMIAEAEEKKTSAFIVSQEDIDSVLTEGSGIKNGKYRIYSQFQKQEDKKKNIEFLRGEYGIGGRAHTYPDGINGHKWHDGKGIAIKKQSTYTKPDLLLSWSKVEKRLRELIKTNRYLSPKEKDRYADYLESVSAPQYEIDTQRKLARQRFIQDKMHLPPVKKRDTLALRLSDFVRDLDGYEKDMLSQVERTDLSEVSTEQMEQCLSDPDTVQQLVDFLSLVQKGTGDVYNRSNAWKFIEELKALYPLRYLYHEGDMVYISADKYEIITISEDNIYLQNTQFPILGQNYSLEDFEEKLRENPINDHLQVIVAESQKSEVVSEEKAILQGTNEAQEYEDSLNWKKQSTETEEYPVGEKGRSYDVVVEKRPFDEPEHKQAQSNSITEKPNVSAERNNYRITDDALGVGGAKEKFRNNMAAIHLLHELQIENRLATSIE
jgi:hypothetical protein